MRYRIKKETRKAMNRSGTQECPICHTQCLLIEHHINGRNIPNPNHASNLAYICDNDHRLIHEGKIIIEGYFQTTDGLKLLWHSADKESFSNRDSKPYIIP
jgi:hypothetical protein